MKIDVPGEIDGQTRRSDWATVACAAAALVFGNGPVMQFSFGVFINPLASEFDASRGQVSAALTVGLVLTGLCLPIMGRLIDRHNMRRVTIPFIVLFGVAMASASLVQTVEQLTAVFTIIGIAAVGQTPLAYSRAIARRFDRHRGLALGWSMAGVGVGAAIIPMLCASLITQLGWRATFACLGAMVLFVALPTAWIALSEPGTPDHAAANSHSHGTSVSEALATRDFWLVAVAFFLSTIASSGLIGHIVPLLGDFGVPSERAVVCISVAGLSLIVGRVLSGWLVDRIPAKFVGSAFFAGQALGVALVACWGASMPVSMIACSLVGLGLGAEVDLMGYMLARMFGTRSFGTLYGIMFGIFMLANGLGPFAMGRVFSLSGNYDLALPAFGAGLALAIMCLVAVRGDAMPTIQTQPGAHGKFRHSGDRHFSGTPAH